MHYTVCVTASDGKGAWYLKTFIATVLTSALYLFLLQVSFVRVLPDARLWWGTGGPFALKAGLLALFCAGGLVWGLKRRLPQQLSPVFWLFWGNALFLACVMWGEWL